MPNIRSATPIQTTVRPGHGVEIVQKFPNCFCDRQSLRKLYQMRFFSSNRSPQRRPRPWPPAIPSPFWSVALACAFALLTCCSSQNVSAQPAGTPPPKNVFDKERGEAQQSEQPALPIDAFLFLSESENQVVMPGMTWEKLQHLIDLEAGADVQRDRYTYQSLEITGSTDEGRAELEIVLRVSVDPTEDRWISIPLNMGNFHQLAPPDVTGVDEYDTRLLPDGKGYQLMVKTDSSAEVVLRMLVSSRVQTGSQTRSLEFRLPDVPSKVVITTDSQNATGEVMGRGDETAIPSVGDNNRTKFSIESSGGTFSLRWGELTGSDQSPLLEVESRISVRWVSPETSPIASVRTSIRSLRGSIDRFQLRLPPGTIMPEPPQLGSTGQTIELCATTEDETGIIHEVLIPEQERRPRIDINYDLQMESKNASSRVPFKLRLPEVLGSLRHHGELEIRTSGDYRLRWRTKSWIQSEASTDESAGESGRGYRFRFDRITSDLPIWLGRKESQLRMVSHSTITIRDSMASLEMTIRPSGQMTESNLMLDESAWQLRSIENLQTERPLDSSLSDFVRVIELDTNRDNGPAPIRIRAVFPLDPDEDRIELPLPRVVDLGDAAHVHNATVDIVSAGRTVFVVDMGATKDLRRNSVSSGDSNRDRLTRHFQVLNLDSPIVIVGDLVDQPPQITFSSNAKVELDGRQLRTKVDWTISSRTDLEGRLPIRIPRPAIAQPDDLSGVGKSKQDREQIADDNGLPLGLRSDQKDRDSIGGESPWSVTVDDVPAVLRPLDDDRYELISDQLTDGSVTVRWQHVLTLGDDRDADMISPVSLPRPNIADVTIRGTLGVELEGDQRFDLVSIDSPGASDLQLGVLPRDPILVRIKPRQTSREELMILQSVLTTVVGNQTRHEQVLARVQGGEQFRVGLPSTFDQSFIDTISVQGFVDSQPVAVRTDQSSLVMMLPGDQRPHAVDLRIWYPKETPSSFATVEPTVKLPIGSGRTFWQIIAPGDGHVVWTTPTLGRSMTWQFDRWRLFRTPTHSIAQLASLIPSESDPLPSGNRYLYVGSDIPSFQVLIVSRVTIWLIVGACVLCATVLLTHVPAIRRPISVVAVAVLFAGLLVVAPDAAVLAGQLGIISLVLVIAMVAIRSMVTPNQSSRIFTTVDPVDEWNRAPSSIRDRASMQSPANMPATQIMPPPAPTEASS